MRSVASNTFLWELIQSLSKAETSRFMDRAHRRKRNGTPDYVLLFQAIRKFEYYDEEVLQNKYKGTSFINHLPRRKNYLYHAILDAILEVREDAESSLYHQIGKIKVLYEKGLVQHIEPLIPRARALALQMENFQTLRKLLEYERNLMVFEKNWQRFSMEIDLLHEKEILYQSQEENLAASRRFLDVTQKILGTPASQRPELLRLVTQYPAANGTFKPLSVSASSFLENGRYNLALIQGKLPEARDIAERLKKLYEDHKGILADFFQFSIYVTALYNLSMLCIAQNDFEAAREVFSEIGTKANAKKRAPVLYFEKYARFQIALARKTLDFETGNQALPILSKGLQEYESSIKVGIQIEIAFLIAVFLLNFGKPKQALPWIMRNYNQSMGSSRPDILAFNRLLFLVAHFELQNLDMVERGIRSTETFLGKHKRLTEFEKAIFKYFRKLIKANPARKEQVHTDFALTLDELLKNGHAHQSHYFNFSAWLKARILKVPMAEILKEEFATPDPSE